MPAYRNAGLRSDGELVQALADTFDFRIPQEASGLLLPAVQAAPDPPRRPDRDHDDWIDLVSFGVSTTRRDDDDDGLPDTIIWCIDGDGSGTAQGEIMVAFDIRDREWSVNGEVVEEAGLSSLLWL
jgi:hypothetical protein